MLRRLWEHVAAHTGSEEMMEVPLYNSETARDSPGVGDPMQAYREVAQSVIASAVLDLVKGRVRAEEAYQFLCGAGNDNRAMLEFWCFVAGYSPDRVMSKARGRSVCAWRAWWRAHGRRRLRQIQAHIEQMRPRFTLVNDSGTMLTEEERDGWGRVLSTGGLNGEP